jgi:hypothetical protein
MRSPTFSINKLKSNSASIGRFWKGEDSRICYDTTSGKNNPDRVIPTGSVSLTGSPHQVRSRLGPVVAVGLSSAISWATQKKGEEERDLASGASTKILAHGH